MDTDPQEYTTSDYHPHNPFYHNHMITLIRPLLFAFLKSDQVKRLIVDMLHKLAQSTDNKVDDQAVKFIEDGLFPK